MEIVVLLAQLEDLGVLFRNGIGLQEQSSILHPQLAQLFALQLKFVSPTFQLINQLLKVRRKITLIINCQPLTSPTYPNSLALTRPQLFLVLQCLFFLFLLHQLQLPVQFIDGCLVLLPNVVNLGLVSDQKLASNLVNLKNEEVFS
jgi:hypothetical protein